MRTTSLMHHIAVNIDVLAKKAISFDLLAKCHELGESPGSLGDLATVESMMRSVFTNDSLLWAADGVVFEMDRTFLLEFKDYEQDPWGPDGQDEKSEGELLVSDFRQNTTGHESKHTCRLLDAPDKVRTEAVKHLPALIIELANIHLETNDETEYSDDADGEEDDEDGGGVDNSEGGGEA